uniref:TSSK6 activating cochaperone n=1 Tax=Rhinolophus ferrumequinum TaxID=59479 RepID=A0A671ERX4_RHIFE
MSYTGECGAQAVRICKREAIASDFVPAKEEGDAVPLCRAKPSPSFINLQASAPPAIFLNLQASKLHSGKADHKPKERLGLLECMYANLLLQTQLAQEQMAILEHVQASITRLAPGRESKDSSLPLPRFSE